MSMRRSVSVPGIQIVLAASLLVLAGAGAAAAQPAKDVNVVNTPNVTVTNSDANPVPTRDVDTSGRQPVMASASVPFPAGESSLTGTLRLTSPTFTLLPEVPAGKRLVAQFISVGIDVPQGQKVQLAVHSKLGSASLAHAIGLAPPQTIAGTDSYHTSQPILVFVDAEGTVDFFVTRFPSTGAGHVVVTMTGSLVDVP